MLSKCSKCESTRFELVEQSLPNAIHKTYFVQCSSCGTPIGVMPYFDIASKISESTKTVLNEMSNIKNTLISMQSEINNLKE